MTYLDTDLINAANVILEAPETDHWDYITGMLERGCDSESVRRIAALVFDETDYAKFLLLRERYPKVNYIF